jgi:hypothetical protein
MRRTTKFGDSASRKLINVAFGNECLSLTLRPAHAFVETKTTTQLPDD